MDVQLDPKAAASSHIHVFRCLGKLASENDYRCHPNHEPGGYDVGFGMILLNTQVPFTTFKEAQEYALLFREMLARVLRYDREGKHAEGIFVPKLDELREVDVFGERHAYVHAERYLKRLGSGPYRLIGSLRRCRFGWLARYDALAAWKRWDGELGWYTWEGESEPKGPKLMLLVTPPFGLVYQLEERLTTIEERLQDLVKRDPEVTACYTIDPDYDTLVNAGVEGWRAESVLDLSFTAQIEVVWRSIKHGDLDPRFINAAKTIVERCAAKAGVKLSAE